ncbi:hypothetical protein J0J33_10515 (plasmid) [Lactococcus sp. LG1267]|uniref:hypothetical protein n=1 Tax=Lactococcus TaxID=1357 RepID=UPI001A8DAFA5|nr:MULTISPECIES: hypothetical protein [Lactococcus]QSR05115.1 hypothetical protein J0J33_10515 [Lactococcus sp. LG1267]QUW40370.1 hypothetical protein [Lactococcus garvieae]
MDKDPYHLKENKYLLQELGQTFGNVLNRTSMINFIKKAKNESNISKNVSFGIMVKYLVDHLDLFDEIRIYPEGKEPISRYVAKYCVVSPYEIALSLLSNSFLSHYSALYVNDLTINEPKDIYINREQTAKPKNDSNAKLTQGKIDYAFSKPMRRTNTVYLFRYKGVMYNVFVLNSKNTKNTGIIKKKPVGFSKAIRVTNLERTLVDTVVRPQYSGGFSEILEAYKTACFDVDLKRINKYIKKFDYIYPYEKSILLYLKYTENQKLFNQLRNLWIDKIEDDLNFYLDYQMLQTVLDKDLNIYYPKDLK